MILSRISNQLKSRHDDQHPIHSSSSMINIYTISIWTHKTSMYAISNKFTEYFLNVEATSKVIYTRIM